MNSETMRTEPDMISTQEAAAILNVSLPYLAKHIESGELNAVKIGSSLCLSRAGVRRYKDASIKQRKAALDDLAQLLQELSLGLQFLYLAALQAAESGRKPNESSRGQES